MVRKRGPLDRIEKITKRRCLGATPETASYTSLTKNTNMLNDRLLSLYKQDIPACDKSSQLQNDEGSSYSDQTALEPKSIENTEKSRSAKISVKSVEKKKSSVFALKHSAVTYDDVGGLNDVTKEIIKMFMHIKNSDLFRVMGVQPVRGFLLHGPPGCGKTHLAQATAGAFALPYIEVAATELVCGISGESESKIRDLFDEAVKSSPCILFLDEIDSICTKRETSDRGMERRMVTQLIKCLDELNEKDLSSNVMVIGATNKIESIDPALRRGGRFDKEISIGMPDEDARLKILQVLCKKLRLHPDFDMKWLAHYTPGYVGADLKSLITAAVEVGLTRIYEKYIGSCGIAEKVGSVASCSPFPNFQQNPEFELSADLVQFWSNWTIPETEFSNIYFEQQDFQVAIDNFTPNSKKEGFAGPSDITWEDVGALDDVKKELQAAILWPVKYKKKFEISHMSSTKGILLYGPKGCGKTLLAKAIANECSINFLSVKGPELLSMYLGESEKAVRVCFQRARTSAPCVIFFDEIDALCPPRSNSNTNAAAERVVNQLLTEMDGMEERKQVFVVGATNRLEKIDSAMLRPGRLEKVIYVGLPSPAGRVEILKRLTKNKTRPKIADDVDLETIGLDSRCENFSGADLAFLLREASTKATEEDLSQEHPLVEQAIEIKLNHFELAFRKVKPSVT